MNPLVRLLVGRLVGPLVELLLFPKYLSSDFHNIYLAGYPAQEGPVQVHQVAQVHQAPAPEGCPPDQEHTLFYLELSRIITN